MAEENNNSMQPPLIGMFQHYHRTLAKMVARIVKPHDIEDIVQDTYVRIYQVAQREPIRYPKSLMLKAARNIALNHVTRADALNHLTDQPVLDDVEGAADSVVELLGVSESPETLVAASEEFQVFCRAIRELPLQCRRAFILKKVYGMSQRDVAKRLCISESTVEKHIAKGLATCSAYMSTHGYSRSGEVAANEGRRVAK